MSPVLFFLEKRELILFFTMNVEINLDGIFLVKFLAAGGFFSRECGEGSCGQDRCAVDVVCDGMRCV